MLVLEAVFLMKLSVLIFMRKEIFLRCTLRSATGQVTHISFGLIQYKNALLPENENPINDSWPNLRIDSRIPVIAELFFILDRGRKILSQQWEDHVMTEIHWNRRWGFNFQASVYSGMY